MWAGKQPFNTGKGLSSYFGHLVEWDEVVAGHPSFVVSWEEKAPPTGVDSKPKWQNFHEDGTNYEERKSPLSGGF